MKFKMVSSGQSVDDALVVTQTLLGNSLKPLAPVNLRGSRNADGDLLIEWTRRSRVGAGLRPSSDVPLAEETETYDVDIMDGADVVRSVRVTPDSSAPIQWIARKQ